MLVAGSKTSADTVPAFLVRKVGLVEGVAPTLPGKAFLAVAQVRRQGINFHRGLRQGINFHGGLRQGINFHGGLRQGINFHRGFWQLHTIQISTKNLDCNNI